MKSDIDNKNKNILVSPTEASIRVKHGGNDCAITITCNNPILMKAAIKALTQVGKRVVMEQY